MIITVAVMCDAHGKKVSLEYGYNYLSNSNILEKLIL